MVRPRKEEQIDIARQAIEATVTLLETREPSRITMADVAAAVGCRAPALYNHFRNKEALMRAVHDEGFRRLYAGKLAVAARTEGDALARLREGGRAYVAFALDNPALYRLMFSLTAEDGAPDNAFRTDVGADALGFLTESIQAVQREGYLAGRDPERFAFLLWSTVHGAAILALGGRTPAGARDKAALLETVVDGVMDLVVATAEGPREANT